MQSQSKLLLCLFTLLCLHSSYKSLSESGGQEALDLQVDYWLVRSSGREDKEKEKEKEKARVEGGKYTLKTSFRTLQVARLAPLGVTPPVDPYSFQHLTLSYATKEKKQRSTTCGFCLRDLKNKFHVLDTWI